jgi:ribosomal protein S18 acetylase RimI-like enzyme
VTTDAERLHAAHCTSFELLCQSIDGARFERRPGYWWMVVPRVRVPSFNCVWPEDDFAAPDLEAALAEIAELALPYSVQTRPGKTPACEQEAERLGLMEREEEPAMFLGAGELQDVTLPELQIVRIETADGLAQALAVCAESFGVSAELFAPLFDPGVAAMDGAVYYLGRVGREDVTTGIGVTIDDAVGIFSIATPPRHRGRGYGAAITAEAVRDGFHAGAEFAWLHSSPLGYRVYHRLGFRHVETYVLHTKPELPLTGVEAVAQSE